MSGPALGCASAGCSGELAASRTAEQRREMVGSSLKDGSSCASRFLGGCARPILGADALQVVAQLIVFVAEGGIALVPRALVQVRLLPCGDKAPVGLLLVPLAVLRVEPRDVAARRNVQRFVQAAQDRKSTRLNSSHS